MVATEAVGSAPDLPQTGGDDAGSALQEKGGVLVIRLVVDEVHLFVVVIFLK